MKSRTYAIAGAVGKMIGFTFGTALMMIVIGETMYGLSLCLQSERED